VSVLKGNGTPGLGEEAVAERSVASMVRARSLQSRLTSVLAMVLCAGLGLGLLAWYYGGMWARHAAAGRSNPAPAAGSDSLLPPLGPVRDPRSLMSTVDTVPETSSVAPASSPSLLSQASPAPDSAPQVRQTALERRLGGPAFAQVSGQSAQGGPGSAAPPGVPSPTAEPPQHPSALSDLLTPSALPAGRASELPTQRLLLAKGAFIDCTLETAIDSSLPGMTTCITATDTFSVDGKVVLLERGSKLIGETRGQVQQGSARLFVLWTEARTPTGVVVPLASPGTDPLGRSGLDGEVERHFWQRFGAAILISMVDAAAQAAQRAGGSGTVIYDTSSSQGVATEALRGTIGIAPTITKNQGDRIQILVARDLDFRQVYQLRPTEVSHQQ
jgi:type IV secretion system protein VirB10